MNIKKKKLILKRILKFIYCSGILLETFFKVFLLAILFYSVGIFYGYMQIPITFKIMLVLKLLMFGGTWWALKDLAKLIGRI